LRADHATVDDALVQVRMGDRLGAVADLALLEPGQHFDFTPLERGLEAIRETNPVRVLVVGRRLHDDANRAARMEQASGTGDVHQRHDPRAHRENQVGMVMYSVGHGWKLPTFWKTAYDTSFSDGMKLLFELRTGMMAERSITVN